MQPLQLKFHVFLVPDSEISAILGEEWLLTYAFYLK